MPRQAPCAAGPSRKSAQRLLGLLVGKRGRICALDGGEGFGVFAEGETSPQMRMSRQFVDGMIASDLLVRTPAPQAGGEAGFEASEAAAALYRRLKSGDDEMRAQHWSCAEGRAGGPGRPKFAGDSPLDWLRRRKGPDGRALITQEEYDAGERLREDFTRAQLTPRVTGDLSAPMTRSGRRGPPEALNLSEAALAAKQRYQKALDAVGPQLAGVLVYVCCHLGGLEEAERAFGWPQRSGKVVLQLALERLAEHYGMRRSPRAQAFRSWREPGAKPEMFAVAEA